MKLEHIVRFEAGYDCIRFECANDDKRCIPGTGGTHGKHGMSIRFLSKGPEGAVQFVVSTDWLPQYTERSEIGVRFVDEWASGFGPMPSDLGYHSKAPIYESQTALEDSCEFTDGGPCYYDGSGLNAMDAMYALVNGGDGALWAFLDAYYESVFHDAPYPTPAEYRRPLRGAS